MKKRMKGKKQTEISGPTYEDFLKIIKRYQQEMLNLSYLRFMFTISLAILICFFSYSWFHGMLLNTNNVTTYTGLGGYSVVNWLLLDIRYSVANGIREEILLRMNFYKDTNELKDQVPTSSIKEFIIDFSKDYLK